MSWCFQIQQTNNYQYQSQSAFLLTQLPIPDSRFPIPDSRFPIPDSRFPIPNSQFPIPCSRFPIPDSLPYNFPVSTRIGLTVNQDP
ncbi:MULTISPECIES: hypothetical protein [unclassified Moorena]|uniref:hypothetical protein n=1 Tax=unclassified Moorena TaxID=2683338 RepID=UPI0013FE8EEC|nr:MULTISPECIES: hypothetical protein [unclassified Moorena]NEO14526.1 hypothetical protein [Moorena sp. SIO3E8]NEQ01879.1 hypothetical protein [Moorena sp. SIO3F7]